MSTPTTCTLLYGKLCYNLRDFLWGLKYPSVPYLPLTWRFAEQPWRMNFTVFFRCHSWRHFHVCASTLRPADFILVKVSKAKLKNMALGKLMFISFLLLGNVLPESHNCVLPLYKCHTSVSEHWSLASKVPKSTQTTFHLTKMQIWHTAINNCIPKGCPFCFFSSRGDANVKIKNEQISCRLCNPSGKVQVLGIQMRNWPGRHFSMDLTRCLQLF